MWEIENYIIFTDKNPTYLPKWDPVVTNPLPSGFITQGSLTLITGEETGSWHHNQTNLATNYHITSVFLSGHSSFLKFIFLKLPKNSPPPVKMVYKLSNLLVLHIFFHGVHFFFPVCPYAHIKKLISLYIFPLLTACCLFHS